MRGSAWLRLGVVLAVALALVGCARSEHDRQPYQAVRSYQAVAVAGDDDAPVFDRATKAVLGRLAAEGAAADQLVRLSATRPEIEAGALPATRSRILDAIAGLRPSPAQGCLVFLTSHGAPRSGLYLARGRTFLTPGELDGALRQGCGHVPTVVVVSACYSGSFAAGPMRRDNRAILTAARADRASFGCATDRDYTFFDGCLIQSFGRGEAMVRSFERISRCVAEAERHLRVERSEPQAYFGGGKSAEPLSELPAPW